jgi:hypothetical protein
MTFSAIALLDHQHSDNPSRGKETPHRRRKIQDEGSFLYSNTGLAHIQRRPFWYTPQAHPIGYARSGCSHRKTLGNLG